MKLPLLIASRYLFARKQKSVVGVISWISLVGLAVSAMALIIVLSVYNGIGQVTQQLFNSFDPPLIIQPAKGKTLSTADIDMTALRRTSGVAAVSCMAEENAWLTYRQQQAIVTLRGVDADYHLVTGLDTMLYEGRYPFSEVPRGSEYAEIVLGADIYYGLGITSHSNVPVMLHIPRRSGQLGVSPDDAFRIEPAFPTGNFLIQQDIDQRYAVTDIATVRRLLDYDSTVCTALAVALDPKASPKKVKKAISSQLAAANSQFTVKDRFEQQPLYYKIFRSERLGIYIILALIVFISTLSLTASLSLLIIDKRRDADIMRSLGMTGRAVRRVFFAEGVMICALAVVAGLAVGFVVCWLQQQFGIVRMGDGNFVVSAFPVAMRAMDFVATFLMVTVISTAAVALTVRRARV